MGSFVESAGSSDSVFSSELQEQDVSSLQSRSLQSGTLPVSSHSHYDYDACYDLNSNDASHADGTSLKQRR